MAGIRFGNVLEFQSNRPAAAIVIAFAIGIAFSRLCGPRLFIVIAAAGILLICSAIFCLKRNHRSFSWILGISAILLAGLLTAFSHRDGRSPSDLEALLEHQSFPLETPAPFDACVNESETKGDEIVAKISVESFMQKHKWQICSGKAILSLPSTEQEEGTIEQISLEQGDRIRGWATWRIPEDFKNPGAAKRTDILHQNGIYVIGRIKSFRLMDVVPGGCATIWNTPAIAARRRMNAILAPLRNKGKDQEAAILSSLVIGDYTGLSDNTRDAFQNSGAYHVLIVSGLHVAWLSGLILLALAKARIPERLRFLIAAILIFIYSSIVGFQASISRCLWMFFLYLTGRMLLRRADPLNSLFFSALLLLVAEPDWLLEAGFQLSFLSVVAIALSAVPVIDEYLNPLFKPLMHCDDQKRLFLEQGSWHCRGRKLRVRCEIAIEQLTDGMSSSLGRILHSASKLLAGIAHSATSMIAISMAVQLWLQPILAYYFNRMSWISPVANLVIVPFSSIVLAAGIAAAALANVPIIGAPIVKGAGALAALLLSCADHATKIPGAWQRCPTPGVAPILIGIVLLFLWSFFRWRKFWIPCAYAATLLACVSSASVPLAGKLFIRFRTALGIEKQESWPPNAHVLGFTFLDVGEGDSIVISFPDKKAWLLDAGGLRQPSGTSGGFDTGEAVVSRFFWRQWTSRIDRLILSHPDNDHAGGMPAVIMNFPIGHFEYSPFGSDPILDRILNAVREKKVAVKFVSAGMQESIGRVAISALNPTPGTMTKSNDNSVVLRISYDKFSAILTGDLEKAGEMQVLLQQGDLRSQLLKVAHHGSRYGSTDLFLQRVQPRWAIISVGRNSFNHPSPETMERLKQHNAEIFLTQDAGAITFETDGRRYVIKSYVKGMLEEGEL